MLIKNQFSNTTCRNCFNFNRGKQDVLHNNNLIEEFLIKIVKILFQSKKLMNQPFLMKVPGKTNIKEIKTELI